MGSNRASRALASGAVHEQDKAVAAELERRKMLWRCTQSPRSWFVSVGIGRHLDMGPFAPPPRSKMQYLYDLVVDLLGAREDRARLKAENDRMRAAILPVVENCERCMQVGELPATQERLRELYLALCESVGRVPKC